MKIEKCHIGLTTSLCSFNSMKMTVAQKKKEKHLLLHKVNLVYAVRPCSIVILLTKGKLFQGAFLLIGEGELFSDS